MKVLKIGAEWCSGCIVMAPRWGKIEEDHPWLITEYYDYDASDDIIEKYSLEEGKLPTFIFLDEGGEEFLRKSGEMSIAALVEIILENRDR
jgi:thiol-disulfide isomerase/thioredoxin